MTHGFSPSAPNNPLRCDGHWSALQPLREYVVNGKEYREVSLHTHTFFHGECSSFERPMLLAIPSE